MLSHRWFLIILSLLLLFSTNFYRHLFSSSPPDPFTSSSLLHHPTATTKNKLQLIHESTTTRPLPSPPVTESILFPDWEVFVLLPPSTNSITPPIADQNRNATCLFHNGATSAANLTNRIPSSSARHGFLCKMPRSVQRIRPLLTPRIIRSDSVVIGSDSGRPADMMRWNRLAYESLSTADDVIVFAKGVNRVQGRDRRAKDVTCVFSVNGAVAAFTAATSSAQEVFRCPHPKDLLRLNEFDDVRVSVKIAGDESAIPTLAVYRSPPVRESGTNERQLTCACTMVYNAAKFLKEWVAYHAAIGVDKFVFYDNGSDDDLSSVLSQLGDEGYDVSSVYWPWQKSQEAGFSHFTAAYQSECAWTAFIDIDEFIYSPSWSNSIAPDKSMIRDLVIGPRPDRIGQVQLTCNDFGPSGQRSHPKAGVTQGYTCRLRTDGRRQRHKSVVRTRAVADSLRNSVHHFEVGTGWETRRAEEGVVVNHYKYQAWSEFRNKFRRRASAYVADWKERRNEGSKDRAPGLGFEEVEPAGWEKGMCEVRDFGLRELVQRWFGQQPDQRFAWE